MSKNKQLSHFKGPLFLLLTILFFYGFSFIPADTEIGPVKTVEVDLFYDIKPDSLLSAGESLWNEQRENALYEFGFAHSQNDILDFEFAPLDYGIPYTHPVKSTDSRFEEFRNTLANVGITGNTEQFKNFFNELSKAGSQQIRIAHFGDSAIEGDNITASLRENFQNKYGGKGAGYISITNQDISFRRTTAQTFSDDWRTFSITARKSKKYPVGISGSVSVPKGEAWVQYKPNWGFKTMREFDNVKVYYSNAEKSTVDYVLEKTKGSLELVPGSEVKELIIPVNGTTKEFKLIAKKKDQAHFYGVSLESQTGVLVDNFPLRGNVGDGITDIDKSIFKQFQKYLHYDLIILQFGLNILDQNLDSYKHYEGEMIKVISYLKESCPDAAILLVGVGDRGQKRGNSFITHPNVLKLIEAQKNIAQQTDIAFWNLFEAMGGNNSMSEWVKKGLGSVDYTHLTLEGASETADLLFESIIELSNK